MAGHLLRAGLNGAINTAASLASKKLPKAIQNRLAGLPGKLEARLGKDAADLMYLAIQAGMQRVIAAEIDALMAQVNTLIATHTGPSKDLVTQIDGLIGDQIGNALFGILGLDPLELALWEPDLTLTLSASGDATQSLDRFANPFLVITSQLETAE